MGALLGAALKDGQNVLRQIVGLPGVGETSGAGKGMARGARTFQKGRGQFQLGQHESQATIVHGKLVGEPSPLDVS